MTAVLVSSVVGAGVFSPASPRLAAQASAPRSPRNANYTIEATLDPDTRTVTGRLRLDWRNLTDRPATDLRFHLYWNAWRDDESTWMRERRLSDDTSLMARSEEDRSRIEVTRIRILGEGTPTVEVADQQEFVAPDDGNPDDRTVMRVPLAVPVEAGASLAIELEWTARVPRTYLRTGTIGDFYLLAHWFPKLGVFEDGGWNAHQFHSSTEFFSDFGVYDVRMTVPRGWVLGGSGREESVTDAGNGRTTHRYIAEDVHDFAWTASPDYRPLTRRVTIDPAAPTGVVDVRLLLQPEHLTQADRHFAAVEAALRLFGEWFGAYPYDHFTIVDTPWQSRTGGMEYPSLIATDTRWLAPGDEQEPEDVIMHEVAHQWWYGVVASNEFEHAWMDEGLATFSTARALEQVHPPHVLVERFFGGFFPWVHRDVLLPRATAGNRLYTYRLVPTMDSLDTPTYRGFPGRIGRISYDKTALWLQTLENRIGWPAVRQILRTYYERWQFRHPAPDDLFAIAAEVSGEDLSGFFDHVYHGATVFDYGVDTLFSLASAGEGPPYRTELVVRRYGDAVFPVDVLLTFEDGHEIREQWDGRDRWARFTYDRPSRVRSAIVDPERVLVLDINYTNNSRTLVSHRGEAATKWSLTWLVWLQDLMLTWGFLV